MLKGQKHVERTKPSRGRHCQTWRGRCIGSWSRWPGLFPLSPFSISWQQSMKWKQCQSCSQTRGQGKIWKAKSTLKPSVIILGIYETSPPVKKPVLCTLPSNLWCLEKNQPHLHKKSNSPYRTRWWSGCRDLIPVCLLLLMKLRSCCLVGQMFTLCVGDRNVKKGIYLYCLS